MPRGRHSSRNLLNYGQITNNVRLQDAKLQQLLIDYQNMVLSAQQEVDNGLATYLQSRNQAAYLRRSVEAANGALRIGLEQYEQGATSFTTVLTAEQNLFQAQNSLAGASAAVPLGLTAVFRAIMGDGKYVKVATSSARQRLTRCVRKRTGATCSRPRTSRNRQLQACQALRISGRRSGRPIGRCPQAKNS